MQKNSLLLFLIFCLVGCDFTPYYLKFIEQGQDYLSEKNYKEAAFTYKKILNENPPKNILVRINFQLGEIYSIYLMKPKEAMKYYYAVTKIADKPLWLVKSEEKIANLNFSFIKNYKSSQISYKRLMNFKPKLTNYNLYLYRYLASIFYLEDYNKFRKSLDSHIKNINQEYKTKLYYLYALSFFYQSKYNKCIAYLKIYLSKEITDNQKMTAKLIMANSYEYLEQLETAYNLYYELKKTYPNSDVIDRHLIAIYNRKVSRKR